MTIIEDHDLPATHHFAVVQQGDQIVAYVKRSHRDSNAVMADCAAAAYRLAHRAMYRERAAC